MDNQKPPWILNTIFCIYIFANCGFLFYLSPTFFFLGLFKLGEGSSRLWLWPPGSTWKGSMAIATPVSLGKNMKKSWRRKLSATLLESCAIYLHHLYIMLSILMRSANVDRFLFSCASHWLQSSAVRQYSTFVSSWWMFVSSTCNVHSVFTFLGKGQGVHFQHDSFNWFFQVNKFSPTLLAWKSIWKTWSLANMVG